MYLYILKCKNERYYIGSTPDLKRRLEEHERGKNLATRHVLPVSLVFSQSFSTLQQARQAEYWLKKQKDKQLIEQVVSDGRLAKFG